MSGIELDVAVEGGDWAELGDVEALARRAVAAALAVAPARPSGALEAGLLLADDAALRELNRTWRGIDKATNVLSFPAGPQPAGAQTRHLGDIAIAYGTVAREAEADGKTILDHMTHLVIHGALHLLGHDHETEAEARVMEALEIEALARLGIADPYRSAAA